jgi:predicted dinucleotide-binding enzyme
MPSRRFALSLAAAAAVFATRALAQAMRRETIAIIGTGNVGSTLGKRWGALGHTIIYGSRNPSSDKTRALVNDSGKSARAVAQKDAGKEADIVVLATPPAAGLDLAPLFDGKIIVDAMNEMSFQDGKLIEPPNPEALAARIQKAAPNAHVVKALNATSWRGMADPKSTGGPITIPIAGATDPVRARVTALLTELGLEVFDMGGPEALRNVEHLGRIYVAYSSSHRLQRMEYGFRTWP